MNSSEFMISFRLVRSPLHADIQPSFSHDSAITAAGSVCLTVWVTAIKSSTQRVFEA